MLLPRYASSAAVALDWLLAVAWSVQAFNAARGMAKLPRLTDQSFDLAPTEGTSVVVIVPACNEQGAIEACILSLVQQDWPHLRIVAVDDRSTDATGAILDQLAERFSSQVTVLHVTALPPGWLGKPHAMAFAVRHAEATCQPRWLLFTDGDVLFHPQCLRRSLALAEAEGADHLVTAPTAIVHTLGEGIVMSFLQVLGLWGARLWRVADPSSSDAVGIGAFNLIRRSAYQQIGGFERLRLQVLEDLALARLVKDAGLQQRVALAPGYVQVHWASGIFGVLHTMTKNLFAIFQFRLAFMIGACMALLILCIGPFVGLLWTETRPASVLAVLAIASLYHTADRRLSGFSPWYVAAFPVSTALFLYAIVRSAVVTIRDGGVRWRGTLYPLAELRRSAMKLR